MSASRTQDGGRVVGTSVFYSVIADDVAVNPEPVPDEVERLNQELQV